MQEVMKRDYLTLSTRTSLVAQMIKRLSTMRETQVQALGWEEGNGNHSSTLAWKIPWTEEPGRLWGRKGLDMTE